MKKVHVFILVACFFTAANICSTDLNEATCAVHQANARSKSEAKTARILKIKELPNGKKVSRLKTVQDVNDAQEYLAALSENAAEDAKKRIAEWSEVLSNRKEQLIKSEAQNIAKMLPALIPAIAGQAPAIIEELEKAEKAEKTKKEQEAAALLAALWLAAKML